MLMSCILATTALEFLIQRAIFLMPSFILDPQTHRRNICVLTPILDHTTGLLHSILLHTHWLHCLFLSQQPIVIKCILLITIDLWPRVGRKHNHWYWWVCTGLVVFMSTGKEWGLEKESSKIQSLLKRSEALVMEKLCPYYDKITMHLEYIKNISSSLIIIQRLIIVNCLQNSQLTEYQPEPRFLDSYSRMTNHNKNQEEWTNK